MNRSMADRTKQFALQVIALYGEVPKSDVGKVIGRQMLRSGTSVGAHGREAFRSRSNAELISKLEVALQEIDETMYWMELLIEAKVMQPDRIQPVLKEADEVTAVIVSSVKTIKSRKG